jgi:hypothetical protein
MQRDKCQATNEDKYWGYFAKINFMSPKIVVDSLKIKGIIKEKLVILSKLSARLHVVIAKDTRMSVYLMILKWKLAYSLSIKNKHLKQFFK